MARGHKAIGLTVCAFCFGVALSLILPIFVIAIIEAILILWIGYFCLCKW